MSGSHTLGRTGEEIAAGHLEKKGYRILHRNWKSGRRELDIVAENDEFVVFVEVKTRTSAQWGNPEDFVGKSRMRRMVDAANYYLIEKEIDKPARFDIIGLVWNGKRFELEHIDDAFLPFL